MSDEANAAPAVSIIVPVKNEALNIAPLVDEIVAAFAGREPIEIIYVDDGSTDGTAAELARQMGERSYLRALSHAQSCGQSAAVRSGARIARGEIICTIDGDGENDPAYLPAMVDQLRAHAPQMGLVAGQRVGRKASGFKRWQSKIANKVRGAILRDGTRDTGCGLKCIRRDVYLALPYFDALHRFTPALVVREGFSVGHLDVVDRQRRFGVSNYGFWDRLWVGIQDLIGVWWLIRRRRRIPQVKEIGSDAGRTVQ